MAFQFPWTNLHELNLDWFLSKFKQFTNNYLKTTATVELIPTTEQPEVTVTGGTLDDDTDIVDPFTFNFKLPINTTGGAVDSVNGQTGDVVLDKNDIGLGNVANVAQYSASNPPPYPVTSVNGQTGDVIVSGGGGVSASDIAWVENTTTASRTYKVGDYVTVNGVLCQITASVTSGATLTENTNYIVISGNGGGFNNLGKITTAQNYTIIGNICFVNMKYIVTADDQTNGYMNWLNLLPKPATFGYYTRIVLFGSREGANFSSVTMITLEPNPVNMKAIISSEVGSLTSLSQHSLTAGDTYYVKGFYII